MELYWWSIVLILSMLLRISHWSTRVKRWMTSRYCKPFWIIIWYARPPWPNYTIIKWTGHTSSPGKLERKVQKILIGIVSSLMCIYASQWTNPNNNTIWLDGVLPVYESKVIQPWLIVDFELWGWTTVKGWIRILSTYYFCSVSTTWPYYTWLCSTVYSYA